MTSLDDYQWLFRKAPIIERGAHRERAAANAEADWQAGEQARRIRGEERRDCDVSDQLAG